MTCKRCDHLLAAYERTVKLYTSAARKMTGTLGDDFNVALAEAEQRKIACGEASDRLMAHWDEKHSNLKLDPGA